jgi:predicted P-loop ATPase
LSKAQFLLKKFRPPYGKTIKQFRRYTSFIGTTNQQKPLVDPTGSRRFVCVGLIRSRTTLWR